MFTDFMTHTAKAVANYFLDLAWQVDSQLTPMKIQKLVYYGHGWNLGLLDKPLIDEQVEAWKFGPVIRSLYHEFKEYGDEFITRHATSHQIKSRSPFKVSHITPEIGDDRFAKLLLGKVWEEYRNLSAIQLSRMTHEPGSPWDTVCKQYNGDPPKGTDIPTDLIKQYFKKLASE